MNVPPPGLLHAVRTYPDPEDWDSWLVFADWLMEHGDPRGEVILRAHQGIPPDRPDVAWGPAVSLPPGTGLGWRHGFVVEVHLRSEVPVDENLHALRNLAADPATGLWTGLTWWVDHRDEAPGGNDIDDDGAGALAAEPALARLRSLDLGLHYSLGDAGAAALARSPHLGSLRRLCLFCADIREPGIEAIASSPALAGLRALDLSGANYAGDGGLRAIARSPTLRSLEALDVGHFGASSDAVLDLVRSPALPAVRRLVLSGNEVSEDVLRAIASERRLPHLVRIEIDVLDEQTHHGVLALIAAHPSLRALVLHVAPHPPWREELRAAATARGIEVHERP